MTDLAKLVVRLEAQTAQYQRELEKANKKLDRFGASTKKTLSNVGRSFAVLATTIGAAGFTKSVISTTANMEKLQASLKTVTGSAEGAKQAFSTISDFAATTPFQLEQAVSAFIKLKALGLDPSEAALRSYGNTAAAMGKDLNQFIEAVADASTNEFERLKEFGIKAKQEGDQVSFTFQGITTTVQKSATAIQGYLQDIGDVQFAGAMEEQANTLSGIFSNIQDSVTKLLTQDGASMESLKKSLRDFGTVLNDPKFKQGFDNLASSAVTAFTGIIKAATTATNVIRFLAESLASKLSGPAIGDLARIEKAIKKQEDLRIRLIDLEYQARGTEREAFTARIAELDVELNRLRQLKALSLEIGKPAAVDQISVDTGGNTKSPTEEGGITAGKESQAKFQALVESLMSEEEQIRLSYERRRLLIEENTIAGSEYQAELIAQVRAQEAQALLEHEARLGKISAQGAIARAEFEKKTSVGKTKSLLSDAIKLTQGVATSSKTMFKINKAAAIAQAVVSMPGHIATTMSKYPFPISIAMGALAAASSLAQIKAAKSAKFGGGGSGTTPSAAGSVPTVNSIPIGRISADVTDIQSAPQKEINVTINNSIDPTGTRRILDAVNEALGDGAQLNVGFA